MPSVHVGQQENPSRAVAVEAPDHRLPDLRRRVLHPVHVGRVHQFHVATERPQAPGDHIGHLGEPVEVIATGFDRDQLAETLEVRSPFGAHPLQHRSHGLREDRRDGQ
jgi:hypothetical protein